MTLEENVKNIKFLSELLEPYSFPKGDAADEIILFPLKQRVLNIDGYEVLVFFNKCQYEDYILETVQVYGRYFSFLPFNIVIKVYKLFFDVLIPAYSSVFNKIYKDISSLRKTYIWIVYKNLKNEYLNYKKFPVELESGLITYNDFSYVKIKENKMRFF